MANPSRRNSPDTGRQEDDVFESYPAHLPALRGFSAPEGHEESNRSGALVDTDLIIRARFGSSRATKLVPIAIGLCLFDEPVERRKHAVRIDKPPMAGIPFLQLCPE